MNLSLQSPIVPHMAPLSPYRGAIIVATRRGHVLARAGHWLADKAQRQASEVGTQQAARNLRKQGMPVELALLILAGRS